MSQYRQFPYGLIALCVIGAGMGVFLIFASVVIPDACAIGKVRYSNNPFDRRAIVVTAVRGRYVKFKDDLGRESSRETLLFWRDTSASIPPITP